VQPLHLGYEENFKLISKSLSPSTSSYPLQSLEDAQLHLGKGRACVKKREEGPQARNVWVWNNWFETEPSHECKPDSAQRELQTNAVICKAQLENCDREGI